MDLNHDSLIQSQMSYLLDDRALWGSIFVTRLILAKHYWPRHESLSPGGMYMGCMKRFELSMPSPQLGVLPLHHKHHVYYIQQLEFIFNLVYIVKYTVQATILQPRA